MRDVAAALVCVVAGREKLLRGKLAMTDKGKRFSGLLPNSHAAIKRMECGTIKEGEFMLKGYGLEK
jgi:hypothetical protein